jgi:hypothetical protein
VGEKKELREEIETLREMNENYRIANKRRQEQHNKLLTEIFQEMIEKPFTIITASGKVIAGRASQIDKDFWPWKPEQYKASITLHPKH